MNIYIYRKLRFFCSGQKMSTTGPIALSPEKRRHARVVFTRSVKLLGKRKSLGQYSAKNLSLGGMFIEGDIKIPVGEECRLELHETGSHSSLILTFSGKILRCDRNGVGVAFTEMEKDSFMFLQTMVLYSSDDPTGVAENFLEDFAPGSMTAC
jgi:hypothetical protein